MLGTEVVRYLDQVVLWYITKGVYVLISKTLGVKQAYIKNKHYSNVTL